MAYASFAQFVNNFGLAGVALGTLTQPVVDAALDEASEDMDQFFGGRWKLPLASWPANLFAKHCCWIAAYTLMTGPRGFNPSGGSDVLIKARYDQAMEWLDKIQRSVLHPTVVEVASDPDYAQPEALTFSVTTASGRTATNRGW